MLSRPLTSGPDQHESHLGERMGQVLVNRRQQQQQEAKTKERRSRATSRWGVGWKPTVQTARISSVPTDCEDASSKLEETLPSGPPSSFGKQDAPLSPNLHSTAVRPGGPSDEKLTIDEKLRRMAGMAGQHQPLPSGSKAGSALCLLESSNI